MKGIYTCPYCMRNYTVALEGDYLCDCGRPFSYPPIGTPKSSKYSCADPLYLDSSSGSIKKRVQYDYGRKSSPSPRSEKNCPLARASLISGAIGLISFGIFSIPALILGFSAIMIISDPFYNYKGTWIAVSGIFLGFLGTFGWGLWLLTLL